MGLQAKITTDITGYAPAGTFVRKLEARKRLTPVEGYVTDNTEFVRGLSPMHDSGTGASSGTFAGPSINGV